MVRELAITIMGLFNSRVNGEDCVCGGRESVKGCPRMLVDGIGSIDRLKFILISWEFESASRLLFLLFPPGFPSPRQLHFLPPRGRTRGEYIFRPPNAGGEGN